MAAPEQVYGAPELFAADMQKVINAGEHSDICFVVGEDREKIYAHKIILAARCEVFRAMFAEQAKSPAKTQRPGKDNSMLLVLPDVRPTVFLAVLEHIYTNSCRLSQTVVVDVLASGVEYGLDGLVDCCTKFLLSNVSMDTVCEAIQAAVTYKQEELRDELMAFVEGNTRDVFKSAQFAELSEESLAFILGSDKLQAEEAEIYEAVKEWGTVNMVINQSTLKESLQEVIQHIRFPMLSQEVLTMLEKENERETVIPVNLISKAWKYHATKSADPNDASFRKRGL